MEPALMRSAGTTHPLHTDTCLLQQWQILGRQEREGAVTLQELVLL